MPRCMPPASSIRYTICSHIGMDGVTGGSPHARSHMARMPKAAPPPVPARRGRKPKDVAPPEPVAAVEDAEVETAAVPDLPARGKPGRKPKLRPEAALPAEDMDQPDTAVEQASGQDDMIAEMAYPVSADAGSAPSSDAGDTATAPSQDMASPAKPAARWDRASDTVQFNWPEIERTAAQDGPNQAMAKLLVAARAEGAHSRWPL